jgi:hypothetical protein
LVLLASVIVCVPPFASATVSVVGVAEVIVPRMRSGPAAKAEAARVSVAAAVRAINVFIGSITF